MKLQALNLQLCRKISSTTSIFQLICLPFKSSCLTILIKENFKKRTGILKSNVYYVTVGVLILIFSCCSWYVLLNNDRPFTNQGWAAWVDSIYFQVRSIKKKGKHEKYSILHSIWKEYGHYIMSLLMPK